MPMYAFECESCLHRFDEVVKLADYDKPQACPDCGESAKRLISAVNFNLPGDGFPGKNLRVQRQMQEKNKRLAGKEREFKHDGGVPTLVPNVNGEQTRSWAEAEKLAKSKGKDTTGYATLARKEKST